MFSTGIKRMALSHQVIRCSSAPATVIPRRCISWMTFEPTSRFAEWPEHAYVVKTMDTVHLPTKDEIESDAAKHQQQKKDAITEEEIREKMEKLALMAKARYPRRKFLYLDI